MPEETKKDMYRESVEERIEVEEEKEKPEVIPEKPKEVPTPGPAVPSITPLPAPKPFPAKPEPAKPREEQVKALCKIAFDKGLAEAIKAAKALDNAYVLDEFHDSLVDELYRELVEKGKLKKE